MVKRACMGGAHLADFGLSGRGVNVKMSNIKPAGDLDTHVVQREFN